MKTIATIIIGFIAGLAISGVLGDMIVAVNNSAGKVSAAWSVSRAEKHVAGGNFSSAITEYEKALKKIKPQNKKLMAKVKNNLAMCLFAVADDAKDVKGIENSLTVFSESLEIYKEMSDTESIKQVENNISEAQSALYSIEQTSE